jgi:hypothetical protein
VPPDFEKLNDLMHYALYGTARHGPIEPFSSIVHQYDPQHLRPWTGLYCDDPARFLHVNSEGRVALSPRDLEQKRFCAVDAGEIDTSAIERECRRRIVELRAVFPKSSPCAFCAGWRLCGGAFAEVRDSSDGACESFFSDFVDAADFVRRERRKEGGQWQ